LRPHPAHPQHDEHAGPEPRTELLVVSDLARRHVFLYLLSEGRADPRDRGHPSLPHEILDVLRERLELPRGSPVRDDPERVLPEAVEHVPDFVESIRDLLVLHGKSRCSAAGLLVAFVLRWGVAWTGTCGF